MRILIIDGHGGGIGKQLVASIKAKHNEHIITAVGTNSMATTAMLKAGADRAATGENAIITGCRKTDLIIGPVGIVIADSLLGEITHKMAMAVGQSSAKRVLIPINSCDNIIAGVPDLTIAHLVQNAVEIIDHLG
ncbi:MAG: DUF3842 family protein [Bacillota bacterium]|jgi:hypothetical protein